MPPPPPGGVPAAAVSPQGPTSLVSQPQQEQAQQQVGDEMRNVMMTIQKLHTGIEDLASQYPEFAQFAKQAMDALKDGMVAIVSSSQRGAEVPSPTV